MGVGPVPEDRAEWLDTHRHHGGGGTLSDLGREWVWLNVVVCVVVVIRPMKTIIWASHGSMDPLGEKRLWTFS